MNKFCDSWAHLPEESKVKALFKKTNWDAIPCVNKKDCQETLSNLLLTILDIPLPMCIYWGSDFIQLFNDSYYDALGESFAVKSFANSPQDPFDLNGDTVFEKLLRVMDGEVIVIPISLLGSDADEHPEFNQFTFSPVKNLKGDILGVLKAATKEIESKEGIVPDGKSENLRAFQNNSEEVGIWNYNPTTNKFSANDLLKSWFGLDALDEIDLGKAINVIAAEDKDRVVQAIESSISLISGGNYDIQYTVENPKSGERRLVHAKGDVWFTNDECGKLLNGTLEEIAFLSPR